MLREKFNLNLKHFTLTDMLWIQEKKNGMLKRTGTEITLYRDMIAINGSW
jgi:hypothetical protein